LAQTTAEVGVPVAEDDSAGQLAKLLWSMMGEPIELTMRRGGMVATVKIGPEDAAPSACEQDVPKSTGPVGIALSPLERDILKCIGLGTLTAKAIAARVNRSYDFGLRSILANLCERQPPVLTSGHAGYRLAVKTPVDDAELEVRDVRKCEPPMNSYHAPGLDD
jgi:hypothetical protein